MATILILYGTSEGQTARIAGRLAEQARRAGHAVDLLDATLAPPDLPLTGYRAVLIGSSIHGSRFSGAVDRFIRAQAAALTALPSAFFSVSLTAASRRPEERQAVEALSRRFLDEAGWRPRLVAHVAGALAYSRYGWFTRQVLRLSALRAGGATDTSRDHEYTDWAAVERFGADCLALLSASGAPSAGLPG